MTLLVSGPLPNWVSIEFHKSNIVAKTCSEVGLVVLKIPAAIELRVLLKSRWHRPDML